MNDTIIIVAIALIILFFIKKLGQGQGGIDPTKTFQKGL